MLESVVARDSGDVERHESFESRTFVVVASVVESAQDSDVGGLARLDAVNCMQFDVSVRAPAFAADTDGATLLIDLSLPEPGAPSAEGDRAVFMSLTGCSYSGSTRGTCSRSAAGISTGLP